MTQPLADFSMQPHRNREVDSWCRGRLGRADECVADEMPIAMVYNGISHAVMLATPGDLEDFAVGFSLSEGIVGARGDIFDIDIREQAAGIEIDLRVHGNCDAALRARRRSMAGRTGCGLCGVESLQQAECRAPRVAPAASVLTPEALIHAATGLCRHQRLHGLTGAVHGAAWCRWDGEIEVVREDVGRHNALDKLIGALATAGMDFGRGFVLMSSRASYEIVCKAAVAGIGLVAAISAPTGMAVEVAEATGLTLVGFLRGSRFHIYAHPERLHMREERMSA